MKFRLVEELIGNKLYHATYLNHWNKIRKSGGLKLNVPKRYWDDSKDVICLADDPWVAESFAETSEIATEDQLDNIIILEIDVNQLDLNSLYQDSNVRNDVDEGLYEYTKDIPLSAISRFRG